MPPEFSFLKKLSLPKLSLGLLTRRTSQVAGIDVGVYSAKVVQLKYEKERAVLETYGELLSEGYFKNVGTASGGGFLRYMDSDIAEMLKNLLREAQVTAKEAVFSIPATASFITTISFPKLNLKEIEDALPYEARKYVPIPLAEVILDWEMIETEDKDNAKVLLVAVPREVTEKFKRIAELIGVQIKTLEVETFSMARSLIGFDPTPTAIINIGHLSTTLAIVDKKQLRLAHNFGYGSQKITNALEKGLGVTKDKAEAVKREIGLSEKIEEKEIISTFEPILENLFSEIERIIAIYNRKAPRKVQRVNLTGGGSQLKGLIDYTSTKLGLEVAKGNPFARTVSPAFLQTILRDIGPSFSVAAGLAMHGLTNR